MKLHPVQIKSTRTIAIALFTFSLTAFAEFQPPRDMMEKIKVVESACKKELNGQQGPHAFLQLMQTKDESPGDLSEKCLKAVQKLPPPPGR